MTIYYFHVDNGTFIPDEEGVDLPDLDAARREAVRAAGEMINESKEFFWEHMTPWIMNVTDGQIVSCSRSNSARKSRRGMGCTFLGLSLIQAKLDSQNGKKRARGLRSQAPSY
ncbi:hypothetical protein [Mesorhizobium sp. B2-8-9]|uniref:DUF6894 family protein n=1 Tax=Mesorhizobium sp. B2-8-9 TaxID=2589899 RepID=UPI001125FEF5|nr:hypothetical protein [Mesorhizobium sp. B2-8-9]TPI72568.1 hypothetical protein FJ423_27295 [Mesorhizobium sp. B2-8-9]